MIYWCKVCDMAVAENERVEHLHEKHPQLPADLRAQQDLFTRKAPGNGWTDSLERMAQAKERHAADCRDGNHTFVMGAGKCLHCDAVRLLIPPAVPIPMILHCPGVKADGTVCGARHVDVGIFATKHHHTHSCQMCGFTWRPAVVNTVGVQFLPGFKNETLEWERLCKSCAANLQDAEFHEAKERGCEVCGFSGGAVMNDYLMVRAPGADTVRKGRIERGFVTLVPGALRTGTYEAQNAPNSSVADLGRGA